MAIAFDTSTAQSEVKTHYKGVSFLRNCGAASVGEYKNTLIWQYFNEKDKLCRDFSMGSSTQAVWCSWLNYIIDEKQLDLYIENDFQFKGRAVFYQCLSTPENTWNQLNSESNNQRKDIQA